MNFIEITTPRGILLKIMFDKWQFLAFNKMGKSIYVDQEGSGLIHHVPVIIFVGTSFKIKKNYNEKYTLMKIRKGNIIVPYIDVKDDKTKYFFISTDEKIDMIPVRMMIVEDVPKMVKEIDVSLKPDYIVVDDGLTTNDVIIIKNRYKVDEIIYIELANNHFLAEKLNIPDMDRVVNINMMSTNPVFLSRIHLRSMDLSKINQLLLDFEITALDTEYILNFLQTAIQNTDGDERIEKNLSMLEDLRDSFKFYLSLLQKNDNEVKTMIESMNDIKKLAPFRTLVSKVKSMFPGTDEQLLYTEYENVVMDKRQELLAASGK